MNASLLPFHTQLANAWKTFLHRWGSAVTIQLLMLIPGILMYPLLDEYATAIGEGVDPTSVFQTTSYGGAFVWGFFLLIFLGILTSTALMILFFAKDKISVVTALTSAVKRYIPVLYTSILCAIAIIGALVPSYLLNYWYYVSARAGFTLDASGLAALDAVILIAVVALMIPAAIVTVWLMYAPLLVAVKAVPAGFSALMRAKHLVYRHVWQILWRLIGSIVLFEIVSRTFQSLYPASLVVPYVLVIIVTAFFVEIYKELREGGA